MSLQTARYVGRVGGLAVALGVGAAIAAGQGVAWADSPTGTSNGKDSSQQATGPGPNSAAHSKATLSKIADRVRKNVEASTNIVRKRAAALSTSTGLAAADDPTPRRARKTEKKPARPESVPKSELTRSEAAPTGPRRRTSVSASVLKSTAAPAKLPQYGAATIPALNRAITHAGSPIDIPAKPSGSFVALTTAKAVRQPDSLAGTSPLAPAEPPALLALLGWARRELERSFKPTGLVSSTASTRPAAAVVVDPNRQTPKPAAPVVGATRPLGWVTGSGITNFPPGTPGGYGMAGTDLGIMWDDGAGHVLTLFGDTFDQPNRTGVWRQNVLLRSIDHNLSNGLQFTDAVISPQGNYALNQWNANYGATQVIRDPGYLTFGGSTTTIIPTAAISVTDENGKTTQYANVMSVRSWDTPGRWTTNWSAIAYSEDGGLSWTVDPNTVRSSGFLRSSKPYVSGNQNFQQGAFVKGPADDVDPNGVQYVYSFGTPSGRACSAYVSRVPEDQIRNLGAYEYWAGDAKGWVRGNPSAAVPVIGATTTSRPPKGFAGWMTNALSGFFGARTGGNVGELSVQYNPYLDEYVALSTDGNNNVVMRVSKSPQGVWSDPTILVANNLTTNTGMYAPMIHPWSGSDELGSENEATLYWNLSYWGDYNVKLMETDLSPMGPSASSGTTLV